MDYAIWLKLLHQASYWFIFIGFVGFLINTTRTQMYKLELALCLAGIWFWFFLPTPLSFWEQVIQLTGQIAIIVAIIGGFASIFSSIIENILYKRLIFLLWLLGLIVYIISIVGDVVIRQFIH